MFRTDPNAPKWTDAVKLTHATARAIRGEARAKAIRRAAQLLSICVNDRPTIGWYASLNAALGSHGGAKEKEAELRQIKGHLNWASTSGNSGRSKAMLEQALPYLRESASMVDNHPWILNAENTAIDLDALGVDSETLGNAVPFDRSRRITRVVATEFDLDAEARHSLLSLTKYSRMRTSVDLYNAGLAIALRGTFQSKRLPVSRQGVEWQIDIDRDDRRCPRRLRHDRRYHQLHA